MGKIYIPSRGEHLVGLLKKPEKPTERLVIISHSFKGDKDYQPIMHFFSEEMHKREYATLRFDFYGSGESGGFKHFPEATVSSEVEDLENVMQFARNKGYNKLHLVGLSLGATVSVMAYDDHIDSMVLWSPAFNLKRMHERYRKAFQGKNFIYRERNFTSERIKFGRAMWEEMADIDLKGNLSLISCPVMVAYGFDDREERIMEIEEYFNFFNNQSLLVGIEGGDHDFLVPEAMRELIKKSADFIEGKIALYSDF